ncbi:hypothetical protein IKB17_06345 [bacterium]|nr:hypothetical protein [bacterium]
MMCYNKNTELILEIKKYINEIVGIEPDLVGSAAIGIQIDESDLDFAVSVKNSGEMKSVGEKLEFHEIAFYGERPATKDTFRLLFSFLYKNVSVDITVMLEKDYTELVNGIKEAKDSLSPSEKNRIIEKKKILSLESKIEYENYKISIYKKFCPQLLWLTDIEICRMLLQEYQKKNLKIPVWLDEKRKEYLLYEEM